MIYECFMTGASVQYGVVKKHKIEREGTQKKPSTSVYALANAIAVDRD